MLTTKGFSQTGPFRLLYQKFNLGEIHIIKQSNSELRVNLINGTVSKRSLRNEQSASDLL